MAVFFGDFLPGTFVNQTFCVRSLWGGGRGKFSSRVHTEDISRSPSKSHRVFGAPTRIIVGRARRTPNSISRHLEHGSHFCWVICNLCSMVGFCRWSVAWHGDPAISRNCCRRVPQLSCKNCSMGEQPSLFSRGEKQRKQS